MPEFLLQCKTIWTETVGTHPSNDKLQLILFRKAILDSMPKSVQGQMGANPDLQGCSTEKWEKPLIHYVRQSDEQQITRDAEVANNSEQLLSTIGQTNHSKQNTSEAVCSTNPAASYPIAEPSSVSGFSCTGVSAHAARVYAASASGTRGTGGGPRRV